MLSKNKIKLIKSLDSKKERFAQGLFVAEGDKIVTEAIDSKFTIEFLAGTEEWLTQNKLTLPNCKEKIQISEDELKKISFQKTPQHVMCLVKIPERLLNLELIKENLVLVLDNVQDPGNLGTIIRIADWFGIEHIICNLQTADVYNPKVVQASMGAVFRVKLYYEDLDSILPRIKKLGAPIFGTTLTGENIYNATLPSNGFIMMGNESNGIDPSRLSFLDNQLFIPFYPAEEKRSESLNVAIATAIICSEFRRRDH
jgi:rRNA methylases